MAQAGKFVTAYPADDATAVRLARALDGATTGMRGPRVLSDRALSPASLVHYRYGDFVLRADEKGDIERQEGSGRPADPFVAAGIAQAPRARLVAGRYLITANLHRSVRGAIHLAVDAKEKRTCVLKRAWRDAALMPDGTDARDRLREEALVLQRFEGDEHFPAVWEVVEDELDVFMAMEHLEGKTFARLVRAMHEDGNGPDARMVASWGIEIAAALEHIHAEGLVHRDLNPVNVIVGDGGRVSLIDFELVQEQGTRHESYGAGTAGYMSPGQAGGEPATPLDDLFALGALLYLATTGDDPTPGVEVSGPPELAELITACLSFDATRVSSATGVRSDLEKALRS